MYVWQNISHILYGSCPARHLRFGPGSLGPHGRLAGRHSGPHSIAHSRLSRSRLDHLGYISRGVADFSITVRKECPTQGSDRSCQSRCSASPVQAYSHSSSAARGFSVFYESSRNKCVCSSDPSSYNGFGG